MYKSISISREFGSGGRAIGKLLAKKLGYKYFDNKLVDLAAKKAGMPLGQAKKADETPLNPWFYAPIFGSIYNINSDQSDPERLFRFETEVIREEARKNNCVFVGRSADYALENEKEVELLSYFVYAPQDWRIRRLIETEGFKDDREALSALNKKDKQRKNYYNYFTGREYNDPNNYDLCIDSSFLGIEKTADFLESTTKYLYDNFRSK